jgi:hypothetical protein
LGTVVLGVFILLGFVYSATTMDSAAFVVASVASDKMKPTDQPARWHRLLWAVILGVVTLTLMFLGGLEAIRTVCIVAAFPLIFVIGLSVWSLLRWLKEHDSTAAEKLQAELIIPENWDVANALGAVTSHVLIRQNLTIRPDSRGRYVMEGIVDTPSFVSLEEAEEWAVSHFIPKMRKDAREAGTSEQKVVLDIEDSNASLKDGSSLLLERKISACIKGSQDIDMQAASMFVK